MPRNTAFHSQRHEPFRSQSHLELQHDHITGPFSFLNPTRATFTHFLPESENPKHSIPNADQRCPQHDEQLVPKVALKWCSRDNRKGRHTLVVDPISESSTPYLGPKSTARLREVGRGIHRMTTQYPYWNISWLVATIFTLGSIIWVINAFFAYLPLVQPSTLFNNEVLVGGGVSACKSCFLLTSSPHPDPLLSNKTRLESFDSSDFCLRQNRNTEFCNYEVIGATIFEIGSVLLMIEAVNENQAGCFGM